MDARTWLALGTVYLVWGSTYLGIAVVVETAPALLAMGVRFVLAGAILAAVLAVRHGPRVLRLTRRQWASCALVGTLLMAGGNGLVALAERDVPSGLTALIIASTPLWIVLLRRVLGVRPRPLSLVGVVVGLVGVGLVVAPGGFSAGGTGGSTTLGVALILAASLSWATGSVASPRLPLPQDPLVTATAEMLVGGTVMVVARLLLGEGADLDLGSVSTASWIGFAYLILVGSLVGYSSYIWLLANAPLPLVATYAYVNPVVAVVLGAALLSEPVTAAVLLGGAVVVAGVALVVSAERRPGQ